MYLNQRNQAASTDKNGERVLATQMIRKDGNCEARKHLTNVAHSNVDGPIPGGPMVVCVDLTDVRAVHECRKVVDHKGAVEVLGDLFLDGVQFGYRVSPM